MKKPIPKVEAKPAFDPSRERDIQLVLCEHHLDRAKGANDHETRQDALEALAGCARLAREMDLRAVSK